MCDLPDRIIGWYATHARDLPWRESTCTAWGVLVSEVMSHQTPVGRVEPVWREWMARWPTPADLAAATPAEVIRVWGRLGYPRRALRLREAAVVIRDEHEGIVPRDPELLQQLPGIGEYTAAAVACFAYGAAVPVIDTNVRRVVARLGGRAHGGTVTGADDRAAVTALIPSTGVAQFAAGLMELGALVCRARDPQCSDCPLIGHCMWYSDGRPGMGAPIGRGQKYAGTDRAARGHLLAQLRSASAPIPQRELGMDWPDPVQRDRALASLLGDGLAEQDARGRFRLPVS